MESVLVDTRADNCPTTRRVRVRIRGEVQGVGFRPFVYGLARRYALAGFVANDAGGVVIEVEGSNLNQFLAALDAEAPPLARVDAVETEPAPLKGEHAFAIARSLGGAATTRVAPDAATCEACLDELFDPKSRFHLYPFVNCTHCGPRYTIIRNCLTTGRGLRWQALPCAAPVRGTMRIPMIGASTPKQPAARNAGLVSAIRSKRS